ncbi:hypothetical protein ACFLZ5_04920 [Thermodesulfobacteriota bacterium]
MKEVFPVRSVDLKALKEGDVNARQLLIGLFVLIIGVLFYYLFRSAEHTYFLKFLSNNPYCKNFLSPGYILIGNSLPTFIHVVAFTLMTAGIIARQKRGYVIACLFWFAVDFLFEVGQGLDTIIIQIIPDWFSGFAFLENSKSYFLQGRFDSLDLFSIALGSLTAYIILIKTREDKGGHHENQTYINH